MSFDANSLVVMLVTLHFYHTVASPSPQYNSNHYSEQRRLEFPAPSQAQRNSMNQNIQQNQQQYPQHSFGPSTVWKRSDMQNSTYAEDDPYYPIDRIQMLSNALNSKFEFFFTKEKVELRDEDEIISARVGGSEEYGLCDSSRRTVFPRKARNRADVELYIVNVDGSRQGVLVEECSRSTLDTACSHSRLFPSGTTATCRQHYTYRRLVALSQDGRQTITDDFKFPSCCKCMLSDRGGGLYSRFGGQDAEPQQPRQTSTTQRSETTLFTFSP